MVFSVPPFAVECLVDYRVNGVGVQLGICVNSEFDMHTHLFTFVSLWAHKEQDVTG